MPAPASTSPRDRLSLADSLERQFRQTRTTNRLSVSDQDLPTIVAALRQPPPQAEAAFDLGRMFVDALDDSDDPWAEVMRVAITNMRSDAWAELLDEVRESLGLPLQIDEVFEALETAEEPEITFNDQRKEAEIISRFGAETVQQVKDLMAKAQGVSPEDIIVTKIDEIDGVLRGEALIRKG